MTNRCCYIGQSCVAVLIFYFYNQSERVDQIAIGPLIFQLALHTVDFKVSREPTHFLFTNDIVLWPGVLFCVFVASLHNIIIIACTSMRLETGAPKMALQQTTALSRPDL